MEFSLFISGFVILLTLLLVGNILRRLWLRREARALMVAVLVNILAGGWVFRTYEPTVTNWTDAFYMAIITLTTIGYGDFTPTTAMMKWFSMIYILSGLAAMGGLIGLVTDVWREGIDSRVQES